MFEQTKASKRRLKNEAYVNTFFVGHGIDIGAGPDPLSKDLFKNVTSIKDWDLKDGDAQYMASVDDNTFDFVSSSHCLEHMVNPYTALYNWIRICKSGGYLIIAIPDEILYEHGFWPSRFNSDHKWSFTTGLSNLPKSINVVEMLKVFSNVEIVHVKLITDGFDFSKSRNEDQTKGEAECAIEFVLKKK